MGISGLTRREGRHPACAVEILVGGRSAPGHSRGVVHRRPSRHPPRGPVGRMGPGRLDERLLHGFPGADVPCRDVESRNVGAVWQIHRRGGALPREGHPAGTRREHLPHAAQRPQFRVHGRGPTTGDASAGATSVRWPSTRGGWSPAGPSSRCWRRRSC